MVQTGTDEHGDPVASCAVVLENREGTSFRRVLPPKSGNQRVAWEALGEMLRAMGDTRPKDAPERLPHGRPAIALQSAIETLRDRLACDPKRKTERAQQALTGLQARGLIVIEGGYVWVA